MQLVESAGFMEKVAPMLVLMKIVSFKCQGLSTALTPTNLVEVILTGLGSRDYKATIL